MKRYLLHKTSRCNQFKIWNITEIFWFCRNSLDKEQTANQHNLIFFVTSALVFFNKPTMGYTITTTTERYWTVVCSGTKTKFDVILTVYRR